MPERIQRKRTRGWRMPEGAVYVGRPTLWGNLWRPKDASAHVPPADRAAWCVSRYRSDLEDWGLLSDYSMVVSHERWQQVDDHVRSTSATCMREYAAEVLAGLDLACWCPLDQPCHADVLLEISNGGPDVG